MLLSTEVGQQKESNLDLPSRSSLCSCQRAAGVGTAWPLAGLRSPGRFPVGTSKSSPHFAGHQLQPRGPALMKGAELTPYPGLALICRCTYQGNGKDPCILFTLNEA